MIKAVALGVVCLAGVGVIAAAAKRSPSPQPPELVFPVAAGNKADRLPINSNPETLSDADKVNALYAPPVQEGQVSPPQPPPRPSKEEVISPSAPDFVPRHWHDPHDVKAKAGKPKTIDTGQAKKLSPGASNEVAEARSCRSDGLDPLLRKLNLSPLCNP